MKKFEIKGLNTDIQRQVEEGEAVEHTKKKQPESQEKATGEAKADKLSKRLRWQLKCVH